MTNTAQRMTGAYKPYQSRRDSGSAPRVSGAKSHIFQPPRTPSASASSSLILTRSTTSVISTTTSIANASSTTRPGASRKRTLNDYNDSARGENARVMDDWEVESNTEKKWMAGEGFIPASPQPFVNTRYQLAGGMDTPTLAAAQIHDYGSGCEYMDIGYRRSLSDQENKRGVEHNSGYFSGELEGSSYFPLGREANGRRRGYNGGQNNKGWSVGAVSVLGAVVGKAWEFCKAGATVFTGFRAGGGQAYMVNRFDSASHFEAAENEHNWEVDGQECFDIEREVTPVPGRFPEEDFIPDYMDNPASQTSPFRPTKRRQISGGFRDEEIAKNWIVVPNQITPSTTPTRPQALPRSSLQGKRLTPRRSIPANNRPASRAGLGPGSSRTSLLPRGSHAGSPSLQPSRGASFASARSPSPISRIPRASPLREMKPADDSPAAREAKKWKALMKKEEREADESIRRLDAQLKAMIREGKEALGTKFEVEVEDDSGFDETSRRKWAY